MALPDNEAELIADELAAEIDRLAGAAVQQALAEIMLGKQARGCAAGVCGRV
jgi:ribosomal protein S3